MENAPIPNGNTWNTSNSIGNLGSGKVNSLKEVVEEINSMIGERNHLSDKFIAEAEKMKTQINNFLLENAPKGEDDSEFTRERAELRKKQIDISELQLNEKVAAWKDIALLKRELREWGSELSEKTSRADTIRQILGEDGSI